MGDLKLPGANVVARYPHTTIRKVPAGYLIETDAADQFKGLTRGEIGEFVNVCTLHGVNLGERPNVWVDAAEQDAPLKSIDIVVPEVTR